MEIINQRPFLKWAGGKYRTIDIIRPHFPKSKVFIEPFVGAGSVFLNTDYQEYILNDINSDLINLYNVVKNNTASYIKDAKHLFHPDHNDPDKFYELREKFNQSQDSYERAVIFLYLNKFGFNGLCRYNRKGQYNVPFGRYKTVGFDEDKINNFAKKAKKAQFYAKPFEEIFELAPKKSVIYCDPPYASLSDTANFTSYHTDNFNLASQLKLAELAEHSAKHKQCTVIISNHDTANTRLWYQNAEIHTHQVKRYINSQGKRPSVGEVLAIYQPKKSKELLCNHPLLPPQF